MASDSEESGSDIGEELLTSEDEEESDDEFAGVAAGFRGPWIQMFDTQNFTREINDFIPGGPLGPTARDAGPIALFEKQVSNGETNIFTLLTQETNRYAEQYFQENPIENQPPHSRSRSWRDVTEDEIKKFLGLLMLMGMDRKPSIESYWSTNSVFRSPAFPEAMSRNRFQNILRFLHAVNNEEAPGRDEDGYDPAGKIKPLIDLCNEAFSSNYRLARDITVDERMVGFKGRHHMVQYMANKKAHRWGIKLWTLSEADTGYTHRVVVYKGRQRQNVVNYPNGLGYHTVTQLVEPHFGKHHHVTFDSYFTSPRLCHDLLDQNTYSTGTVCVRRRGMPRSYRKLSLPKGETKVMSQGDLIAVHWSDRRPVNFLSTFSLPRIQNSNNSRGQEVRTPLVVQCYNRTMGGVDLGDQMISEYIPDIRSVKMWKKVLFNLITTATVNAFICYKRLRNVQKKMSRLDFTLAVCTDLISAHQEERRVGRPPLNPPERLLGRHFIQKIAGGGRMFCRVCGSRVRTCCQRCHVGLCVNDFRRYHTVVQYEQ